MSWIPERNGFRCDEHGEWFRRGACCPHPGCAEAAQDGDAPLSVFAEGAPTVAWYEDQLRAIGDMSLSLARSMVEQLLNPPEVLTKSGRPSKAKQKGPRVGDIVKLFDASTKAYRGGIQSARWREDWKNARVLRELLSRVKRERSALAAERRGADAEVRH